MKHYCCICGDWYEGFGNNPAGAMMKDPSGKMVELIFKDFEKCCDECNKEYVIPGRMYRMANNI